MNTFSIGEIEQCYVARVSLGETLCNAFGKIQKAVSAPLLYEHVLYQLPLSYLLLVCAVHVIIFF
jgi:hypothetical protein